MKFKIFLLSLFYISRTLYSQTYFEKTYGSAYDDEAYFIENTNDKGFVVTGRTKAGGIDFDIFIMKIDSLGQQEWFRIIKNAGNDCGRAVRQTCDNGYIVGGEVVVNTGPQANALCYTLAKFNVNGNLLWQSTYDNGGPSFLSITKDGGFLMAGNNQLLSSPYSDAVLMKTDSTGSLEWYNVYDGGNNETYYGFSESDDGYMVVGYTNSFGTGLSSGIISKIAHDGLFQWSRVNSFNTGYSCFYNCSSHGSSFLAIGETESASIGSRDIWIYKFDTTGNTIWSRAFGTRNYDESFSLAYSPNGEITVAGSSDMGNSLGYNGSLFRCDDNGNLLWSKTYGGVKDDSFADLKTVGVNGTIACGFTKNGSGGKDIYIVRTDNNGNIGLNCSSNTFAYSIANINPTTISVNTLNSYYGERYSMTPFIQDTILNVTNTCSSLICTSNNNVLLPYYEFCNLTPLILDAGNPGYKYHWSTNDTSETITISTPGKYWVDITKDICSLRVETSVNAFPSNATIGTDPILCPGESILLSSPLTDNLFSYLWSDGSTNSSLSVSTAGNYNLSVSFGACTLQTNTINVSIRQPDNFFPNLITKNRDGKNDTFHLHHDLLGGTFTVANSWGNMVYQNNNYQNEFDGSSLSDGIYYYYYRSPCGKEFNNWIELISN
ncbi:MAG: lipoprotein [Chitinophagaceae bacterium]|nr:lipoprotein [Chitinophagaceae bacterium]